MKAIACAVSIALLVCPCLGHTTDEKKPAPIARAEFVKRCHAPMTAAECRAGVGAPSKTQRISGQDMWYFEFATTDPATGKVDAMVQVVFNEDGKVQGLNFY